MRALLRERNPYHALLAPFYDRMLRQPLRLRLARLAFSSRLRLGSRLVGWQVARTARYFYDHIGALPAADHVSVRYEDLCDDPRGVVNRLLAFLGEPENPHVEYRALIRARRVRPPVAEDGDPAAILRRVELQPYLAYCGYHAE
jgi:hypothetical protein